MVNAERIPTDEELGPPGHVEDWPPEIDEQWPDLYLDKDEIRAAADLAGALVSVRPEWGLVAGKPLVIVNSSLCRFSDEYLDGLTAESTRALLHLMNHAYSQTFVKMTQLMQHVHHESVGRDPSVALEVVARAMEGRSDSEIAAEIGESEKFVQRVRLDVGQKQVVGPMKRPRGRPRKGSAL